MFKSNCKKSFVPYLPTVAATAKSPSPAFLIHRGSTEHDGHRDYSVVVCTIALGALLRTSRAGVSNSFSPGPHQPRGCLPRADCNFNSLTVKE